MTAQPSPAFSGSAVEVRRQVSALLAEAGVPAADVDAGWLVAAALGTSPTTLALSGALDDEQVDRLAALVARRVLREPLQHILGSAAFRYLELAVGPGVFVPRPETEVLVDLALAVLAGGVPGGGVPGGGEPAGGVPGGGVPGGEGPAGGVPGGGMPGGGMSRRAVDLCSGSGAIALALATERPLTDVWAVELDEAARGWLERNVAGHEQVLVQRGSHVWVVAGDATSPPEVVPRGVDLVTCNPPYIPNDAVPRDPEVAKHDPAVALYGGLDGLDVVRGVVAAAADLLRPGGWLLIEHGDAQGGDDGVPGVVAAHGGFVEVADHRDLAGRPRVTAARRP